MLIEDFNRAIDYWIKALEMYDLPVLRTRPAPASWSLGQLYHHLIDDTNYYIEQIKICVSTNVNAEKVASPTAKALFCNNSFPDEVIEGAPSNAHIVQPESKEQLKSCLKNLKDEMNDVAILIKESDNKGKTKHPGLDFFGAEEWLQFAEMHFRHHIRQKKRIDDFLKDHFE